ncbi:putative late blight resistance protein homolog R1B-16 [Andrographis paniculata]|uniref:putative late blight resistance protein homolog R1B-16 n=1 Tax=Andrographis paniculata TaxID=175694 RepID=UPI0021E73277|nr:putative late blight resistance protein homolog R1B-16 [Andrographis paniculata]
MAAYAALVSLMNTIAMEQTPRNHRGRLISIEKGGLIEALQERADFLVEFLESGSKGAEHLEERIVDAAYAAEDAIDSYMMDRVLPSDNFQEENGLAILYEDLQKITQEMDCIKNEMKQIEEESSEHGGSSSAPNRQKGEAEDLHRTMFTASSSAPRNETSKMVGFEDERARVMVMLTSFDLKPSRAVVPIVGMGGAGKTTLARNIFDDQIIVEHFDVRAWVTVSQEYNVEEVLKEVLSTLKTQGDDESLGEKVHKSLFGRRYLMVFDDIWSIDIWNRIQRFFPDCCDGSRILVTSRLSNVAEELSTSRVEMKYLDADNSWNLLRQKVFGESSCPVELLDVGKKIARNCRGLPLAIVVVGGLLAKGDQTIEHWAHVAEQSTSAAYIDDSEHCSKILSLSYNHLPVHLKPCFLYMGVFPEDYEIRVSKLINVWIAEGFMKPRNGYMLEEIAELCLLDLIERNLIILREWGSTGNLKLCAIHDVLRELSLREAQKESFLCVVTANRSDNIPSNMKRQRRIALRVNKKKYPRNIKSLLSTSRPRSLIVRNYKVLSKIFRSDAFVSVHSEQFELSLKLRKKVDLSTILRSHMFGLLRTIFVIDDEYMKYTRKHTSPWDILLALVNLRYLDCIADQGINGGLAYVMHQMRNLKILIFKSSCNKINAPSVIWNFPQLHHVQIAKISPPIHLHREEQKQHCCIVLKNLRTLKGLVDFKFDEGVVKKIRDLKKMIVTYNAQNVESSSQYSLHNLGRLQKLESFKCSFKGAMKNINTLYKSVSFPHSLTKLSLYRCGFWDDVSAIGSLPNLEVLKLKNCYFHGAEWNPVEGEFISLDTLYMELVNIKNWNANSTHFPRLKLLELYRLTELNEIPLDIGEIATLRFLGVWHCSKSAIVSARNILEEQESLGNDGLVVRIAGYGL